MKRIKQAFSRLLTRRGRIHASRPGEIPARGEDADLKVGADTPDAFGADASDSGADAGVEGESVDFESRAAKRAPAADADVTVRQRRPLPGYYPARRIPETMWLGDAVDVLAPLVAAVGVNSLVALVGERAPLPPQLSARIRAFAHAQGDEILEEAQRRFFDNPGLDTLVIQAVTRWWKLPVALGRVYLRGRIVLGLDPSGVAAKTLPRIPRRDYESLMASYLAIGTAIGWFRGGTVGVHLWYRDGKKFELPEGHPTPHVRRLDAPRTLVDMAADIDDMYWAETTGQVVKITRVGQGQRRRWLISLPGTDHVDPHSTPNPADSETNVREVLGLRSAVYVGVVNALRHAMASEGVSPRDMTREPVVIMGHSQGGMIALSLLDRHPREVNVRGVVTMGTPGRRMRVPRDVAVLALEHDQDIVPSMDGRPRRQTNDRVVVGRRLNRPRTGPLWYAHSSATYTETMQLTQRRAQVSPESKIGRVVARMQPYLPQDGEDTSVFVYEIVQELLSGKNPTMRDTISVFGDVPEGAFPPPIRGFEAAPKAGSALGEWIERVQKSQKEKP
ncbi:MAG: alpha/beta fold hydrolase [Actinomycetaceae bacterium]|nr:alpha/beta fold hydrolase [Actinomycetaceae bacterium]